MEIKTFSLVSNAERGESIYLIGKTLGSRHSNDESVVFVFGNADLIPQALLSFCAADESEILKSGVAVHIGITHVESTVRLFSENVEGKVHVFFLMPGHFTHSTDEGNLGQGLPLNVRSDTVRRIISMTEVNTVTMFVDKEQENV